MDVSDKTNSRGQCGAIIVFSDQPQVKGCLCCVCNALSPHLPMWVSRTWIYMTGDFFYCLTSDFVKYHKYLHVSEHRCVCR